MRSILAEIYSFIVRIRLQLYQTGIKKIRRAPKPVISIGNITLGGTGKTPFTIYLCRILAEAGLKPAVLSRGYRGTGEKRNVLISNGREILCSPRVSGDEPRLIAESLPGTPVAVGGKRYASAKLLASDSSLDFDIYVLDDGFQHIQLHREIDLALIDATSPFGGDRLIPAGILREPLSSLARADAFIVTRTHLARKKKEEIRKKLKRYNPAAPVFFYRHRLSAFKPAGLLKDTDVKNDLPLADLPGKAAFVLAAIGNPLQFLKDLEAMGFQIAGQILMRDHHAYTQQDIERLVDEFKAAGADFIVTTEKDLVRMRHLDLHDIPFFAAVQEVCSEEESRFKEWLSSSLNTTLKAQKF